MRPYHVKHKLKSDGLSHSALSISNRRALPIDDASLGKHHLLELLSHASKSVLIGCPTERTEPPDFGATSELVCVAKSHPVTELIG